VFWSHDPEYMDILLVIETKFVETFLRCCNANNYSFCLTNNMTASGHDAYPV